MPDEELLLSKNDIFNTISETQIKRANQHYIIELMLQDQLIELNHGQIKTLSEDPAFGSCYKLLKCIQGMIAPLISSTDKDSDKKASAKIRCIEAIRNSETITNLKIKAEAAETLKYIEIRKIRLKRLHEIVSQYYKLTILNPANEKFKRELRQGKDNSQNQF